MTDNKLKSLNNLDVPEASDEARSRALGAAMQAYDAAHADAAGLVGAGDNSVQGSDAGGRLRSIRNLIGRIFDMDTRIPIGVTAVGLLLLPLAVYLTSTTSLTQLPPITAPATTKLENGAEVPQDALPGRRSVNEVGGLADADDGGRGQQSAVSRDEAQASPEFRMDSEGDSVADSVVVPMAEPAPAPSMNQAVGAGETELFSRTVGTEETIAPPPYERSGDRFESFEDQSVIAVAQQPVSTFSIDVDTASYAYVRRALNEGRLPAPDAVRVEEMINYFPYGYPEPDSAEVPFRPNITVFPTPWNDDTQLMHIGIKGFTPPADSAGAANLVLLIDTSGSMDEPDKLPLLKRAFALLINELDAEDTVSIVTYAGSAGTVLFPTPVSEKARILDALEMLTPGGRTAGAAGIEEAYRLAERAQVEDGVNRVILATDGDFNVGISSPEALEDFIAGKRDDGIFLSVLGFGSGNYNDALMQALAQNGNGNAAYIDSFAEARKVLAEEAVSTLETIAKDVKIQIEFNPAVVLEYRLVGYETRALNREDFNNDRVDAGDVGAGHTVTAIYEITPVGAPAQGADPLRYGSEETAPAAAESDEIAFFKLRYKLPDESLSRLIELPVTRDTVTDDLDAVSDDIRFGTAVAAFGQKLRGGQYADAMSYPEIAELARGARGDDAGGYRSEFVSLLGIAESLSGR